MKVILIDEVRGLGGRGDVVQVKDGYARNFLLPKKLAREATAGNLKSAETEKKKWSVLTEKEKDAAKKVAEQLKGVVVVVYKRVGETGTLFGSVTATEIADALVSKGFEVDKRRIELAQPIKSLGLHDIEVRLHREVTAPLQVEVSPSGEKEGTAVRLPGETPAAPTEAPKAEAAPPAEAAPAE